MLFQIDMAGGAPAEVYPHFWKEHEAELEVREFAQGLVEGVMKEREALDRVISGSVDNWRIERMAVVDRNILRVAVYELAWLPTRRPSSFSMRPSRSGKTTEASSRVRSSTASSTR
jgi:N utilization substance protein B